MGLTLSTTKFRAREEIQKPKLVRSSTEVAITYVCPIPVTNRSKTLWASNWTPPCGRLTSTQRVFPGAGQHTMSAIPEQLNWTD